MDRDQFLRKALQLRDEGKSIRAIAAELGVHRNRVHRALSQRPADRLTERSAEGVFVGRQREMAELKAALEDAVSGRGRVVMLAGEPGIGKTRTSQELAAIAAQRGAVALWGRCQEGAGAPPYWPWIQVIRSYASGREAEQLRSEMGPAAADIAEIVPELRDHVGAHSPFDSAQGRRAPLRDPESARFRLFDGISLFFKNASRGQPLVLMLDNLHSADTPSLLLFEFLAQEMADSRILVLGTYRDTELSRQHPLSRTLGELARQPLFHQVFLRGLPSEDVARFIRVVSDIEPTEELVDAMHSRTEGNPLFMTHVARLLSEDASTGVGNDWNTLIPESVRLAIRRRVDRLPEGCVQVLTVASVIGREFGLDQLEKALEGASTFLSPLLARGEYRVVGLLEALDEALAGGIISEAPSAAGRYRFTHVLIKDALFSELSAARRARLHGEVGEALEKLYGADVEAHAAELTHHFAEATPIIGTEKLVCYSLLAGERAIAAYAWEDALAHFQRALAAVEGRPMDSQKAALLFGLARAQHAIAERHQLKQAVDNFMLAFDYYIGTADIAHVMEMGDYPIRTSYGVPVGKLHAKALGLLPADSHQAGRLLPRYGWYLLVQMADYEGAMDAYSRALAIAQRENDVPLQVRALQGMAYVSYNQLRFPESLDFHSWAIELAHGAQMPGDAWGEYLWTAVTSCIRLGDLDGARHYGAEMLAKSDHSRMSRTSACHFNSVVAAAIGNWATALDFNNRALALSPKDFRPLRERALLEYQMGNFDQGRAFMEQLLEVVRLSTPGDNIVPALVSLAIAVVASISGVVEWFDLAEEAAEVVLSSPSATLFHELHVREGLALMATQRSDAAKASEQYAAMERFPHTMSESCYYTLDHLLGLLAHTMRRQDIASAHFEDALTFCRKAGYRPALAWTCYDYANLLHQQREQKKALALLDEALSISTELNMRPLAGKATALRGNIEAMPASAPTYPADLTERQAEVLRLIAQGKTDREIAQELVLSIRTVQRHIADIYDKIGARNRAEATAFALDKLPSSR